MDEHALDSLDFSRIRELLATFAHTGLGRARARSIRPSSKAALVRRWHNQVRELDAFAKEHDAPPLGGLTDVRETVRACRPPLSVTVEDVARIGDALRATHNVTRYFEPLTDESPELRHLAGRITDFQELANRIGDLIDERGQVRDDASPKLAGIRGRIARAKLAIQETIERLLADPGVRRLLQYPNHTYHDDRMVLPVRGECRGRLPGIVHRSSDSGATIYVEPAQAVEINNAISNLLLDEREEVNRLLWELTHEIHGHGDEILKSVEALAIVDLISAKLRFAKAFALWCPEVVDEPVLNVREARHPLLLEMQREKEDAGETVEPVVPIDYRLGDDFDLLVITGPNTGGKTVTLKTIGLLTLMAQAGLPAPVAVGSRFGLFKHVWIDIGDEQSMQQSLSTFSAHLHRQMEMLNAADRETLVLVDELGAGTDPDEAAAIGKALLEDLVRRHARCVVTTHIGALKSVPLEADRAENGCVEFDIETLRPTYHLRIGEPGMSNAIAIAERLGMPKRIIVAAKKNLSGSTRRLHAALRGTVAAKREAEQARQDADRARVDAQQAHSDAEHSKKLLERQRAAFHEWVRQVVHLQPGDSVRVRGFERDGRIVRMRIDQQRAEVDCGAFSVEVPLGDILPPAAPAPPPRSERPKTVQPMPAKPKTNAAPGKRGQRSAQGSAKSAKPARRYRTLLNEDEVARLEPGTRVLVKRFHREGEVVQVKTSKKLVVVSVGAMEMEVPFDGLTLSSKEAAARDAQQRQKPAPKADRPAP